MGKPLAYILFFIYGLGQFKGMLFFLTQWGLFLTWIYFLFNTILFIDKKHTFKYNFIFHSVFALNIVITFVYWIGIFPTDKKWNKLKQEFVFSEYEYRYIMIVLHTIPLLFITMDFVINKFILERKKILSLFIIHFLYCIINFVGTVLLKMKIYSIVNYKDILTPSIGFIFFGTGFFSWHIPLKLQTKKYNDLEIKQFLNEDYC